MKNITSISFFIIALVFASCSGYNSVVKSDDFGLKFETANELYDKGDEMRALALYEQVYQRTPNSAEGELSYFRIGKAYYSEEDFYMAGYYFGQFTKRFSTSVKAEEALFLSAMCSVSNSPQFSLDQEETEIAINDLQQFVDRYPGSILVDSCNNVMDRLRYKLETKSYTSAMLYSRTENYRAAVSACQTFIDDYPRSEFLEEINYTLVFNSFLLQENSVEAKKEERIQNTIERYTNFVNLYPTSKYLTDLEHVETLKIID